MALISELILKYSGEPIVVMGGSPNLPDDIAKVKSSACWISANEHGAKLRGCDYAVYVDPVNQVSGRDFRKILKPYGVPTISQCFEADYRIPDWEETGFLGNCGFHAIWIAWMLGGNPIIVCGIENYQDGTYWHNQKAVSSSIGRPKSFFDKHIRKLKSLTPTANIRTVNKALSDHFKIYSPEEKFSCYHAHEQLIMLKNKTEMRVGVRNPFKTAKTCFTKGQIVSLTDSEISRFARYLLKC
jgi:hypothetical protein